MRLISALAAAAMLFAGDALAQGTIKAKDDRSSDSSKGNRESPRETAEKVVHFRTCKDARAAGYSRMRTGEPGYAPHLDRDSDGIACE